jgi:hypothetical protein
MAGWCRHRTCGRSYYRKFSAMQRIGTQALFVYSHRPSNSFIHSRNLALPLSTIFNALAGRGWKLLTSSGVSAPTNQPDSLEHRLAGSRSPIQTALLMLAGNISLSSPTASRHRLPTSPRWRPLAHIASTIQAIALPARPSLLCSFEEGCLSTSPRVTLIVIANILYFISLLSAPPPHRW